MRSSGNSDGWRAVLLATVLVSMVSLPAAAMNETSDYDQALASALDFTPQDLAANQRGEATPRQLRHLRFGLAYNTGGVVLLALVIWGGFLPPRERYWILAMLGFIALLGYFVWAAYTHWADRLFPQVEVVRGNIDHFGGSSGRVVVEMGGKSFHLNRKRSAGFVDRGPYTVYYLKRSETPISATRSPRP
jgi:hypothetical protein